MEKSIFLVITDACTIIAAFTATISNVNVSCFYQLFVVFQIALSSGGKSPTLLGGFFIGLWESGEE